MEIIETLSVEGQCQRDCEHNSPGKYGQEMICDHGNIWRAASEVDRNWKRIKSAKRDK
jgi:hypothetical protein